jgi:hypothetical protein
VIASFLHKGLKELFENGNTAKIDRKMHERIKRRLDAIDRARSARDLNVPGFDFHGLKGFDGMDPGASLSSSRGRTPAVSMSNNTTDKRTSRDA